MIDKTKTTAKGMMNLGDYGKMIEPETTLSEDAGLYVMAALRDAIQRIEHHLEIGGKLLADPKNLTADAREYFTKVAAEERKHVEEVRSFLKKVRYGEI